VGGGGGLGGWGNEDGQVTESGHAEEGNSGRLRCWNFQEWAGKRGLALRQGVHSDKIHELAGVEKRKKNGCREYSNTHMYSAG